MTPAQRLASARAHLDQPPTPAVPGQTAIPLAALAVIDAAEADATTCHEDDHHRATRVALYLATAGWTITPAQENPVDPVDRMLAAHDLETELLGGCGICDTEHDEMCAACQQCRCHRHDTCQRPA